MRYADCIDDALALQQRGFVRYTGEVDQAVYDRLACKQNKKAVWFVKGDVHQCIGCTKRCLLTNPAGFRALLVPMRAARHKAAFAALPQISAKDLLFSKLVLRVDEAAYCLNVSEREVYNLIDEGVLERPSDRNPVRVTAASVRRELGM